LIAGSANEFNISPESGFNKNEPESKLDVKLDKTFLNQLIS
jgi:hypothetical protein